MLISALWNSVWLLHHVFWSVIMLIVTSCCLLQNKDEPPSMIVAGSATWSIKDSNASVHALQEYSWNLTRLVQVTSAFVFGFMSEVVNI